MARCSPKGEKLVIRQEHLVARALLANNAGGLQTGTGVDPYLIGVLLDRPIEKATDMAEQFRARAVPAA